MLSGTPFLSTELRKLLQWLTLACFSRKFVQKRIDWTGKTDSFSQENDRKGRGFTAQSGRGFKISHPLITVEEDGKEVDPHLIVHIPPV